MRNNFLRLVLFLLTVSVFGQADKVSVESTDNGMKLVVNGEDFISPF